MEYQLLNLSDPNSWIPIVITVLVISILAVVIYLFTRRNQDSNQKHSSKKGSNGQPASYRQDTIRAKHLEEDKMREIYKDLAIMTATLNYQRVLDTALDLSMQALGETGELAHRLISTVLLFTNRESTQKTVLYVGAARRFIRTDMSATFLAEKGLLREALDEGAPLLAYEISQDPELGRVITLQQCKTAYCIPLRTGLDIYGVMLFAHPDPKFFTITNREVLDIIGNQAMIAIQNARLYQDLEQEKERMMEIQEEARKKLARDLHDGPTQSIAAIAMRVNFARRLMERDFQAASDELQKIEDLARRTTKEIRHMLFTLRPLVLESQGLTAAFESMAEKMKETYDQTVLVSVDPNLVPELEIGKQGVIFYIADEAVTNARKHANAAHIWIRLKTVQSEIALLEIEDDGVGYDVEAVDASYEHRGSLGMVNMRERSELLSGHLKIESSKGKGTRVRVLIPLTEEASDRLRRGV
jgi:signal transduction histidine kinase